jgi:hypothetical protein
MTRATRSGEPDPEGGAAQRLGLMGQANDGTATPRVCGPARGRGQRLGAGVNAVGLDTLLEVNGTGLVVSCWVPTEIIGGPCRRPVDRKSGGDPLRLEE